MTGEGGYFHDTILFPGSKSQATWMTSKGGYFDDTVIKEPVSRYLDRGYWNDERGLL